MRQQIDPRYLLEPAGRRCGIWSTSPFLFRESFSQIPVRGDDGAGAIGATDDAVAAVPTARYGVFADGPIETALSWGSIGETGGGADEADVSDLAAERGEPST